jgi:DNA (cytosine-5)-methyltransferase 1
MLTYLAIAQRHRPQWLVWENVPGVLSSNGGRDFGTFLGALGELGYGFAYRVLDAQWFGVAQRRRRVFVVGYLGDWSRAAAVLFERESVCRDTPPSREARQETAKCPTAGVGKRYDFETETLPVAFSRNDDGRDAAENITPTMRVAGRAGGTLGVAQPIGFGAQMSVPQTDVDLMQTLQAKNPMAVAQPFIGGVDYENNAHTMDEPTGPLLKGSPTGGGRPLPAIVTAMQVRRLTPVECERLQGFPDNYTNIPWRKSTESPDGPRYKALGNSMAVPVMRWIGKRIANVENR